jgi:hypothetical protein
MKKNGGRKSRDTVSLISLCNNLCCAQAHQLAAQSLLSRNVLQPGQGLGSLQENVLEKYGNMLRHLHG